MRVLVTGATGFIGQVTVRRLLDAGHEPVAMVHHRSVSFPNGVKQVSADLADTSTLASAVDGIDAICHLAALARGRQSFAEPLAFYRANVSGTVNLMQALADRKKQLPVVFASTCVVYGNTTIPAAETLPPVPTSPYGATKIAAEQLLAAHATTGAIGVTTIRTFNAAGAIDNVTDKDETRIIPKAIAVAAGREPILQINGDGSVLREYLHVNDLASAYILALESTTVGVSRLFNAGTGVGVSLREVVETVETVTGRKLTIERRPPADEPQSLTSDSSLISHELGWYPKRSDLKTIIQDCWDAEARS